MHPKILFIHNWPMRFVRLDCEFLSKKYAVTECFVSSPNPGELARVLSRISKHHLVFGWFASWHSFLPLLWSKILKVPSILVIGGYDLANLPEIGYGSQRGGLKKHISRWTMRSASILVTNSHYSQGEAVRAGISRDRVNVVYHGVPDPFGEMCNSRSDRLVITVGNISMESRLRKGHEPFVQAGALLPEMEFALVGACKERSANYLRSMAPPNVRLTGWVEDKELLDHYRRASVYVQPSLHEGFGMSVAEAMLAGCIPVVTRAGALPEVVGECGVQIDCQEPEAIAEGVKHAAKMPDHARARARSRILDCFPMSKRERAFDQLIDQALAV